MKKRSVCALLLLALLCALLSSCAADYDTLYEVVSDGLTYRVYGRNENPREIAVFDRDTRLFKKSVKVSEEVGNLFGSYGFFVTDFNFDGHPDFMIASEKTGEEIYTYRCFLGDGTGSSYDYSKDLSALSNVRANASLRAVFGFTSERVQTEGVYYEKCDSSTKYLWKKGALVPEIRASITYYSKQKIYCYSVAYYDEREGAFGPTSDRWLSPEEYEKTDMSFLYYFRNK